MFFFFHKKYYYFKRKISQKIILTFFFFSFIFFFNKSNQRDKDLAGEWSGQARLDPDDRDPIDKRHFVVNLTSSTPKKWKRKDFIVWYKGKHAHFAEKYEISIANGVEPSGYKYTPNVSAEWKGHATEYRHKNWKKGVSICIEL